MSTIHIPHYTAVCTICDWAICWFGSDPWADQVMCPAHPGKKQVPGRNRPGDPVWYREQTIQHINEPSKEHAYGGVRMVSTDGRTMHPVSEDTILP